MTSTPEQEREMKRAASHARHQVAYYRERKCMDIGEFFFLQYDGLHLLADEILLADITDAQLRYAPAADQRSLAWLLWTATRWEDVALAMVERDAAQVIHREDWRLQLGNPSLDLGVLMSVEERRAFNNQINGAALRRYRTAVGQRTHSCIEMLPTGSLADIVPEEHFRRIIVGGLSSGTRLSWLERFLANRSRAWWLSSVIWFQSAVLLGEARHLRQQVRPFFTPFSSDQS